MLISFHDIILINLLNFINKDEHDVCITSWVLAMQMNCLVITFKIKKSHLFCDSNHEASPAFLA